MPHTAEVALEIRGGSWEEFYANAARGLLAVYAPKGRPKAVQSRKCRVKAESAEEVLVAWLNEIVFLVSAKLWLPCRITVETATERGVCARLEGALLTGPGSLATEIKAATFHGLQVIRSNRGLRATIILDV